MKKIFILFGLLSVLLCSCASTSLTETRYGNTDTKVSKEEVEWFFNQEYWTTENYLMNKTQTYNIPSSWWGGGDARRFQRMTNAFKAKFNELINLNEMSGDDYLLFQRINKEVYGHPQIDYYNNVPEWYSSFLKDKEINNNTFTVKFTNTTDETFHLKIHTNSPWRWYKVDIKPHEEKYFTLPDMEENTFISFQDDKYKLFTYVGFESCACDEGYEYSKYLFSNYSLDFTFNPNNIKRKKSSGDTYYYDWKLVPRYENEDNIIKHYMDRSNQVIPTNTENLGK